MISQKQYKRLKDQRASLTDRRKALVARKKALQDEEALLQEAIDDLDDERALFDAQLEPLIAEHDRVTG